MWVHATDDDIANLESVEDMISVFPKIKHQIITINPKDFGYKDLGHMKFFSSKRKELWKYILDFHATF